jgi:hypothetical protein
MPLRRGRLTRARVGGRSLPRPTRRPGVGRRRIAVLAGGVSRTTAPVPTVPRRNPLGRFRGGRWAGLRPGVPRRRAPDVLPPVRLPGLCRRRRRGSGRSLVALHPARRDRAVLAADCGSRRGRLPPRAVAPGGVVLDRGRPARRGRMLARRRRAPGRRPARGGTTRPVRPAPGDRLGRRCPPAATAPGPRVVVTRRTGEVRRGRRRRRRGRGRRRRGRGRGRGGGRRRG